MTRQEYIKHVTQIVESLTERDKSVVFNGCGASAEDFLFGGWVIRKIRVPEEFQVLFLRACLWHDVAAWAGGTSEQKDWSDNELFWQMVVLATQARSFKGLRWAARSWLAVKVGYAVLQVGWIRRVTPLTLEGFKSLVEERLKNA
jgi:hypothetical protein